MQAWEREKERQSHAAKSSSTSSSTIPSLSSAQPAAIAYLERQELRMVTLAMAMQTMKLLMTQTTLAVSFRHMGSIHQPDLHGVGERRDGEKIEEMGAGRWRG